MAPVYTTQYQPISNAERGINKPLTVHYVRDLSDAVNNAKKHVLNHKVRCFFPTPGRYSPSNGSTQEQVIQPFTPVYVPQGYDRFVVTAGHQLTDGAANVSWYVYCLTSPYTSNSIMDNTKISTDSAAIAWNTSSNAHNIAVTNTLEIKRDKSGYSWLMVTAKNWDNASNARLTSLDIWPTIQYG
jgi:hypothetical protein